jgi:large subunit ribosomal protein L13
MKTYSPRPRDIERRWFVIDASGAVLGRLASEVAAILRGKHKPIYAPHMDTGDHVIVVNAAAVRLTGGKEETKIAYHHSGYPGGLTETKYSRLLTEKPVFMVEKAIRGMLPKNRLGRAMVKKLQVYAGPEHPHQAQKPERLALGEVPPWDGLPKREPIAAPVPRAPKAPKAPTAPKARAPEKPAPKRAAAKRTTAKATAAKRPMAKRLTAKATVKTTSAKAATAAKHTTAKATTAAKKTTARKITIRRAKKEE